MAATAVELARTAAGEWTGAAADDLVVDHVTHDSRRVRPGTLFACVPGARFDGHDFAADAVEAGAAALLVERTLPLDVPQLLVDEVRRALGPVSAAAFGDPSSRLAVVGVTGTNGKTTLTNLLASILTTAGRSVEVIGTLSGSRTTPEAPELQELLAAAADRGVDVVAMEVSSHALDQGRVDGVRFAVGVFTNLGHDHLDYHHTLEAYFEAKARLFEPGRSAVAVVAVDDDAGRRLADRLDAAGDPELVRYSWTDAEDPAFDGAVSTFALDGRPVRLPLAGRHNVANAVGAAVVARRLGIDADGIAAGLSAAPEVPGRFQPVPGSGERTVVVDYAHTPDALRAALDAARTAARGEVVVVFGCGGDRDREKRPIMGAVAHELADRVVLTSDNPRSEPPERILAEILAGVPADRGAVEVVVEPDRAAAIEQAVGGSAPGDVVVIAGKGHETTQTTGDRVEPFDDREVAAAVLARLTEDDR